MTDAAPLPSTVRTRRPPPPFRHVVVQRVETVTSRLLRVTFAGPDLAGLEVEEPASSVRLLLPSPGTDLLVVPEWTGNEFLLPDGRRPILRTFTPPLTAAEALEIDLLVVLHDGGAAAEWARSALPGDPAAISGPGRGYLIDADTSRFVLAGDEAAAPAIRQLVAAIPSHASVEVHIEVAHPDGRGSVARPGASLHWHDLPPGSAPGDALVAALAAIDTVAGARWWVAGEAASMQRIRRLLFEDRGIPKSRASVRGYWKHGRSDDGPDEA